MKPLQVRRTGPAREGVVALVVSGELDLDTEPQLGAAAEQAMDEGCRQLVIDCSGVAFCDSQGLNRFLRLRLELESRGGELVLVAISQPLRHVLELTDALQIFRVFETVEDAVSATGAVAAEAPGPGDPAA